VSGDTAASAVSSNWGRRRNGNLCEEEGQGTTVYWATGTDSDTMYRRDRVRQCTGLLALTVTLCTEGTGYGSVLGYWH
jgi:hypothetical protein